MGIQIDTEGKSIIVIKGWHHVILILCLIAGMVVSYATLQANGAENTRRIEEHERNFVRKEQFEDIKDRLARIERKLDEDRAARRDR
jgi:hypothetical protein